MNDFTILHLSDLHINKSDGTLSLLFENLLIDIEREMRWVENIVIVVTGDLVHRGNYDYRKSVERFFEKLKEKLDSKVKGIFIVPGNHDKIRNKLDEKILKEYSLSEKSDEFYKNYWRYIMVGFDSHLSLVNKIYRIFGNKKISTTYGAEMVNINGKRICFLLLNTAWSCLGDKDERNLKFGKFQLEKIQKKYEELKKEKKYDLTM